MTTRFFEYLMSDENVVNYDNANDQDEEDGSDDDGHNKADGGDDDGHGDGHNNQ